jgi:hypothetical protein
MKGSFFSLKVCCSEGSLVRRVTHPKVHWFEWTLVRRFIGLNGHWSERSLVRSVTGVGLTNLLASDTSDLWTFGPVPFQNNVPSDQWPFRSMNLRTSDRSDQCRSDLSNDRLIFYLWFYNLGYDDWHLPCFDYGHFKLLRLIIKNLFMSLMYLYGEKLVICKNLFTIQLYK